MTTGVPQAAGTAAVRVLDGANWDAPAIWKAARYALGRPEAGLVLIPREPLGGMAESIYQVPARRVRGQIGAEDAPAVLSGACRELGLTDEGLREDCTRIASLFFDYFEPATPKFRLEIIDEQPCPKFHCDHVFLRLLCTYCGPPTEYCTPDAQDHAQAFGHGWIGILKGSKHPAHDGVRVLHRSPLLAAGERRLSFALDW